MAGGQVLRGKRISTFLLDPKDVVVIGLDTNDGPEHPLYDERIKLPIDDAQLKSIRRFGVRLPIEVEKDGELVLVTDGRQRVRWAREVNVERRKAGLAPMLVKCQIARGSDQDVVAASITLNECRQADNPIVRARKAQRLLDLGATVDDVAVAFAVELNTVRSWLKLLECDSAVQDAVERGEVPATEATKIARLPRAKQREALSQGPKEMPARRRAPPRLAVRLLAERVSAQVRAGMLFAIGDISEEEAMAVIKRMET